MWWWYHCCWVNVVLLLVSSIEAQTCDPASVFGFYDLRPRPSSSRNPLTGRGSSLMGCNDGVIIDCFTGSPLVDGDLGPVDGDFSSAVVHAWDRSVQRVVVEYQFNVVTEPIRHFNLFFYNIPSMGIGLPNIELFAGPTSMSPLPYFLTGNQDISQTDNRRRNVTLSLENTVVTSIRIYRIEFDFENIDIDWLILSEVVVCSRPITGFSPSGAPVVVTPSPSITRGTMDTISPNLTLSCSVSGEGRFRWQWTAPDGILPSEMTLYDTTRTSMAVFTGISNTGNSMFRCEATYDPMLPDAAVQSGAQDISVDFQFSLEAVSGPTVLAQVLDNVTLSCELSGYLSPGQPQITWIFGDSMDSEGPFSVSSRQGSASIQNGGVTPIPSVVSELTIFIRDRSYFRNYLCQAVSGGMAMTRIFTVVDGSEIPEMTTVESTELTTVETRPTQSQVCPSCSTSIALATVITAIGTALLATAIFVLVQIAVCKCHGLRYAAPVPPPSAGQEGEEYEQMDGGDGAGPTYMEIGAQEVNSFQLKENEAYATADCITAT